MSFPNIGFTGTVPLTRLKHSLPHDDALFDAPGPARRPRRIAMRRTLLLSVLALSNGACSLSFPIGGFTGEDGPTGSINRPTKVLSPDLDGEDWRRARAAMAVALDPQGNGAPVAWNNPQSGAKGSFVALAPPYLTNDRVCRAFNARLSIGPGAERRVAGSACRVSSGDWTLREVKDAASS